MDWSFDFGSLPFFLVYWKGGALHVTQWKHELSTTFLSSATTINQWAFSFQCFYYLTWNIYWIILKTSILFNLLIPDRHAKLHHFSFLNLQGCPPRMDGWSHANHEPIYLITYQKPMPFYPPTPFYISLILSLLCTLNKLFLPWLARCKLYCLCNGHNSL